MLNRLVRGGITLIGFAVGYGVFILLKYVTGVTGLIADEALPPLGWGLISIGFAIIFGLVFFLITPIITRKSSVFARGIEADIKHLSAQELITGTVGLIIGLIIAFLISRIFSNLENNALSVALTVSVYIVFGWLGVVVGLRKGKDVISNLISMRRAGFRQTAARTQVSDQPKILDTSVIIDGRIADIIKCGFIEGTIVIPEFVLVELRHIADSSDGLKRERGRRGLDILNKIQAEYGIEIYDTSDEKGLEEVPEVDVKLLKLAQSMNGKVVTNDFNLNKVAMIQGVKVLNINELANALKPAVLPGEEMRVFLVKEGKEHGQALAYLDDGTMIVVENGRSLIGETIDVSVTTVLQTAAGRMIFAKPK